MNLNLRYAIDKARAENMPKDSIERAIKKGTGELEGGDLQEILFEGYGPGGVAILVSVLTDNRTRTVNELRHLFERSGGRLGDMGSVSWLFDTKAVLLVPADEVSEDRLLEVVLEEGAEDVREEGDSRQIIAEPTRLHALRAALEKAGISVQSAEISRIPKSAVPVSGGDAKRLFHLLGGLEDHDDVQSTASNYDVPEDELEALLGA